jgi:uncharacterized protein (DUF58 family)
MLALWIVMAGALVGVLVRKSARTSWERLEVLTATGALMMWTGAGALFLSAIVGWASLSVIGLLGVSTVCITVTWSALVGSESVWANARIVRSILPALAVEGDALREEVKLAGVTIPVGMRLFATGRAMPHGAISRYVVEASASGAELVLVSELGPARRGDHHAPPLVLWLGDILGLTRTPSIERGDAKFVVLPRVGTVDNAKNLLGPGGDAPVALPHQLPTEGTFRIREYVPGDNARRIHWVRSLAQHQLVVRLPDEVPHAEAEVRLILDTDLAGVELLTCRAPHELLDSLVRVWLGIGKALAANGTRVTLVSAVGAKVVERPLRARSSRDGTHLGARVAWQSEVQLAALLGKRNIKQVIVSSRPRRMMCDDEITWVVVPEIAWTTPEVELPSDPKWTLPFPSGSADNRLSRRKRERTRVETVWNDRALFTSIVCWTDWATFSGDYVAQPREGHTQLAVIP